MNPTLLENVYYWISTIQQKHISHHLLAQNVPFIALYVFSQTVSGKGDCLSHKVVAVDFQTFKSFKTHFGFSALSHFVLCV